METVVCTSPDVCKTPMGTATPPVPYPVVGMMVQSTATATTVKFTSFPVFTKSSLIPMVIGDEAGVATGVKSSTVKGPAKPDKASSTVKVEGKQVCRHDDLYAMNNDNTKGKLVCAEPPGGGGGAGGGSSYNEDGSVEGDASPPTKPETPAESSQMDALAAKADAEPKSWWGEWKESIHTTLDVVGMVPFVGELADGANALLYLASGDVVNAGISAAALLPVGGQVATGTRVAVKGGKELIEQGSKGAAKQVGQEVGEAGAKKADDVLETAAGGASPPAKPPGGGDPPAPPSGGGGSGGGGGPKKSKKDGDGNSKKSDDSSSSGSSGSDSPGPDNVRVSAPPVPQLAQDTFDHVKKTGQKKPGTKGGKTFKNDGRGGGEVLPKNSPDGVELTYKEYDIHPYKKGVNRGAERVVIDSQGRGYYTSDHYGTFTPID